MGLGQRTVAPGSIGGALKGNTRGPPSPVHGFWPSEMGTWKDLDQAVSRAEGGGSGEVGKPRELCLEARAQGFLVSTKTGRVEPGKTEKLIAFV